VRHKAAGADDRILTGAFGLWRATHALKPGASPHMLSADAEATVAAMPYRTHRSPVPYRTGIPDETLVARARQGDRSAWDALIDRPRGLMRSRAALQLAFDARQGFAHRLDGPPGGRTGPSLSVESLITGGHAG
jgi:hypothetical protein